MVGLPFFVYKMLHTPLNIVLYPSFGNFANLYIVHDLMVYNVVVKKEGDELGNSS